MARTLLASQPTSSNLMVCPITVISAVMVAESITLSRARAWARSKYSCRKSRKNLETHVCFVFYCDFWALFYVTIIKRKTGKLKASKTYSASFWTDNFSFLLMVEPSNSNHSGSAFRHLASDPLKSFLLLPWSPMVSPS